MSLETIRNTIKKYNMISPGDSVVAGLSGGPDSVCLFHALATLREELGIRRLCAVHINHGLRGDEAKRDEEYSRCLAERLGAEFRVFRFDIDADAKRQGISSETAGRRARYESFERVCREIGAKKTAVAHNRDDQAETILMRILRGTGTHGLSGIEYVRAASYGKIIRPVLDLSREEIERYCAENGLEPMRDSTNEEPVYTRNKIRLELLPYLRERYNPSVSSALVRLGKTAGEDDDYLQAAAGKIMDKCWNQRENSLNAEAMKNLHPALMKRVITQAASRAGAGADLAETHIGAVQSLVTNHLEGKEADLTHGNFVRFSYGMLRFMKRENPESASSEADSPVSGSRHGKPAVGFPEEVSFPMDELARNGEADVLFAGRRIRLKLYFPDNEAANISVVRLDWERLRNYDNLVFRYRRPGDRIRPKGMKGRKKLQDFMVDRKIPRHLRDSLPLLASGNTILSAGTEVASECCENPESMGIVSIEY